METELKKSEPPAPSVVPALPTEEEAAKANPPITEHEDGLLQARPQGCLPGAASYICGLRQEAEVVLQELAVQFNEADIDHSGYLDADELAQVFRQLYRSLGRRARSFKVLFPKSALQKSPSLACS